MYTRTPKFQILSELLESVNLARLGISSKKCLFCLQRERITQEIFINQIKIYRKEIQGNTFLLRTRTLHLLIYVLKNNWSKMILTISSSSGSILLKTFLVIFLKLLRK